MVQWKTIDWIALAEVVLKELGSHCAMLARTEDQSGNEPSIESPMGR